MRKLKRFELIAIRADETRRQRYGDRPVTLKPIFGGQKREHLISRTMDLLKDWRLSPFEHEGAVRAGLRSGLCLQGFAWRLSDFEAASLVEAGLTRMGAERPTWEQGQPDYTDSPDFCSWCRGPLDDETRTRSQRFCSAECAALALEHRAWKSSQYPGMVLRSAFRLIAKEKAPPRTCDYCGKSFRSEREDARFCSSRCGVRWSYGDLLLKDIVCEGCGKVCKPAHRGSKCCSRSCASSVKMRKERERLADETRLCKRCGDPFTPTVEFAIHCSAECASIVAKRAWYERNYVPKEHHLTCHWCGDVYVSKQPWSLFCSRKCRDKEIRLNKPAFYRKRLTAEYFDYTLTWPANAMPYPRSLTAPMFDKVIGRAA